MNTLTEALSDTDDERIFNNFVNFLNNNVWSKRIKGLTNRKSTKNAMKFYRDKTYAGSKILTIIRMQIR